MSVEAFYGLHIHAPRAGLKDLDAVVLMVAVVSDDGTMIAEGSHGTVVAVWGEGAEVEVEFTSPVAGLATVLASQLRSAGLDD